MLNFEPGTVNNSEKLLARASKLNFMESKIYRNHVLVGSHMAINDDKIYDCITKGFEEIAESLKLNFDDIDDFQMIVDIRDRMLSAILKSNDKDIVIGTNKVD